MLRTAISEQLSNAWIESDRPYPKKGVCTVPGEVTSGCQSCGGSGRTPAQVSSIGASSEKSYVECRSCRGSGSILGREASLDELKTYLSEPCEVTEQIFELVKKIQSPRTVREERQGSVRKQRRVTVRRERKVGGFLGIGAKTEYYDDVDTEYYEEPTTEYFEKTYEPQWLVLTSRAYRTFEGDQSAGWQDQYASQYDIGITREGEFAIQAKVHHERETTTQSPYYIDHGWSDPSNLDLKSLDDIMIHFDFEGHLSRNADAIRNDSEYLGDPFTLLAELPGSRWLLRRKYQKGYGLLASLKGVLEKF